MMQIFKSLYSVLKQYTEPVGVSPEDGIRFWQERVLLIILLISCVLGAIVYIPSVTLAYVEGLWDIVIADTAIMIWVYLITFNRSLSYYFRASSVVLLGYLLALVLLVTVGPFGAGPVWLFFFPIIASLLIGFRYSLLALAVNILTLVAFGFLMGKGLYHWEKDVPFFLEKWVVVGMNFMLLNALATVSIAAVLQGLQKSLDMLKDHQEHLETLVEQRTNDMKSAMNLAESANQAKSEFLANISHELRTPMHHILNYSNFGLNKFDQVGNKRLLHYFGQIRRTGMRLMDLLNDLLDLSKLEARKMDFDMKSINVNVIASEVVRDFEVVLQNKDLECEITDNSSSASAYGDGFRITQVVQNLLSNAIKFSDENKSIRIQLDDSKLKKDERVVEALKITVADQGIGIPETEMGSVFEKFVQSSLTKNDAGGTGLGLAICKEIIDLHRGEIWVDNNPSGGTIVSFKLPRQPV